MCFLCAFCVGISETAPQVDAKPNFNRLEDPEEYFDAYERMECEFLLWV